MLDIPMTAHFLGGVVAYSNEAKTDLLGVDPGLIEAHGAVSPEVAEAMSHGALERFGADVAVAITGTSAQATHLDRLPLGCHRVHVTPPGWSAPVDVGTRFAAPARPRRPGGRP